MLVSGGRKGLRKKSPHTKGMNCADNETCIDSVLREIYDTHKAALPMPSNRDGVLANYVPKDSVKTKRQPDLATRRMLEQASPSSNGDYEQSTTFQFHLDCIDRAVESITELVSIRVRCRYSDDNHTLSLRDVDPTAYDGVWAIVDDGCNSCSHNRARRQNAAAKTKVLGLHPISFSQCEHVPFSFSSFSLEGPW